MSKKRSNFIPWWGIVIIFYFFFPAGLILAMLKLKKEKDKYKSNGKAIAVVGWVLFAFGIIYLLLGITGSLDTSDGSDVMAGIIMMLFVCCGGGYAFVRYGNKYHKLGVAHEKLWVLVSGSVTGSIDEFASACGMSYEDTFMKLQEWIDCGRLSDVRIDTFSKSLVSTIVKETRTVECPNCGGMTTIVVGENNTCEYCGLTLE